MHNFSMFVWKPVFANSLSAFVPQWWAMESLMILSETLVVSGLVHRDFENQVQNYGDTVNTRKPARFVPKRKNSTSNVTVQDASATNVAIKLNQWMHTSFQLNDTEMGLSLPTLLQTYLRPAIQAVARGVDQAVIGQFYQAAAAANYAGNLGNSVTQARVIELREAMTSNLCPLEGRNLVVPPNMEGQILGIDNFVRADAIGGGSTLRNGEIGRIMGFDTFTSQSCPQVTAAKAGSSTVTGALTPGDSATDGRTSFVVGSSTAAKVGMFATVAGDDTPLYIKAIADGTHVTFGNGVKRATAAGAAITFWYNPLFTNLVAGYAAGWAEPLVTDDGGTGNASVVPVAGQGLFYTESTGGAIDFAATKMYGSLEGASLLAQSPSRPLDATMADNTRIGLFPGGNYGFAFRREAVGLISRPLPPTMSEMTGVRSAVVNENGLSLRVTITYDGNAQKYLITVDGIFGVQTYDTALIGILLG